MEVDDTIMKAHLDREAMDVTEGLHLDREAMDVTEAFRCCYKGPPGRDTH